MLRRCFYAVFGAILAASVVFVQGVNSQSTGKSQKPIKMRSAHGDGGLGAPATLEELWSMSSLVIDAVVGADRPADITIKVPGRPIEEQDVIVRTAYALTIKEVFRDEDKVVRAGRIIEVSQAGGDRDRGTHIESVTHPTFPRLTEGQRYLLFLRPARQRDDGFVVATDTADSVLLLPPDGTVQSLGSEKLSQQLDRYSREGFLNRLRMLAEGGR